MNLKYFHVDVFSDKPMAGNGLTVVFLEDSLQSDTLLKITQEFKQFETAFVYPESDGVFVLRIFTIQEELPFAGHPVLGTAAVIHNLYFHEQQTADIVLEVNKRKISISSRNNSLFFTAEMNQGPVHFITDVSKDYVRGLCDYLKIGTEDIDVNFPTSVATTGLPYVLLPVKSNIEDCIIIKDGLEHYLEQVGAKFLYFFETKSLECRTWDNSGLYEDIATGSAAGPLIGYLVKNKFKNQGERITISQGRFVNRPSIISGYVNDKNDVLIRGDVSFFGRGEISI